MKIKFYLLIFAFIVLGTSGCGRYRIKIFSNSYHVESKRIPPGQLKKANNERSAKKYAPGQLKKK